MLDFNDRVRLEIPILWVREIDLLLFATDGCEPRGIKRILSEVFRSGEDARLSTSNQSI